MKKIEKLCKVLGMDYCHDPDPTYELTTDNVKKMMAIFMRFRYLFCCYENWFILIKYKFVLYFLKQ